MAINGRASQNSVTGTRTLLVTEMPASIRIAAITTAVITGHRQ